MSVNLDPQIQQIDQTILSAKKALSVSGIVTFLGTTLGAIGLAFSPLAFANFYGAIGLGGFMATGLLPSGIAVGVKRHLKSKRKERMTEINKEVGKAMVKCFGGGGDAVTKT